MTSPSALALAKQLLGILAKDRPMLLRIDGYIHGQQADPYMPANADDEYRLLASRSVTNMCGFLVGIPAQALAVDGFRRGHGVSAPGDTKSAQDIGKNAPEWAHFQGSRLDARQTAVHRGALGYGHSFTVTLKTDEGQVRTKGLSALNTSAVFEDAANDETPYAALTVTSWAKTEDGVATATLWDDSLEFPVTFTNLEDMTKVVVGEGVQHGSRECPVTRFAAAVDLEGRTVGVVEPMMPLQDRINQSVFDLLVTQTYQSTKVRTVTGMAPPIQRDVEGEPILDATGNPIPLSMNYNAKRFLFAEDSEARFGTLDETPLSGFIESIDMSIRHLSAISQTPPHYLLGQIANLSAEALQAAETSLARKVEEFRKVFGESWERVFRLAADLMGEDASANDFEGEVIWRDMESRSLAQSSDALGKLAGLLDIPKRGLWHRVPGATQNELEMWGDMADSAPDVVMANALTRAAPAAPPGMSISDRVSLN